MGYRHYIGSISKIQYDELSVMDEVQFSSFCLDKYGSDDYVGAYEFCQSIYELGKYYEDGFLRKKHFFKNKKIEKRYNEENQLYILGKTGLEKIIENQREKIYLYYSEWIKIFNTYKENKNNLYLEQKIEKYFLDKETQWKGEMYGKVKFTPYNLNLKDKELVSSWKYEYTIFDLVKLYKTFDYKNNVLVMMAW